MTVEDLQTWADFQKRIDSMLTEPAQNDPGPLDVPLFRGLGNADWSFETTLERWCNAESIAVPTLKSYYRAAMASKPLIETFTNRRWNKLPTVPKFHRLIEDPGLSWLDLKLNEDVQIWEYFAYLRHNGFPSPLLDWTVSPYVAAFFAFQEHAKDAGRVAITVLQFGPSKPASAEEHFFILGPYMPVHSRHFLQQSRYSACVGQVVDNLSEFDYSFCPHGPGIERALKPLGKTYKLTLPVSERRTALRQLEFMNINEFSIFGSEDSLVRSSARRELLRGH